MATETYGGTRSLQIAALAATAVGTERIHLSPQVLKHRHLAEAETAVGYQAHAHRHPVASSHKRLQSAQIPKLEPERVIVIAHAVAPAQQWFSCILCTHHSQFHLITISKLVAEPVAEGIAQIAILVALALIERYGGCCHQLAVPVSGDIFQARQAGPLLLSHIEQRGEELPAGIVYRGDHQ